MATVNHPVAAPYVLKTASVTITLAGAADADDFTDHIDQIALKPSTQTGSWTGISGNVIKDAGIASWDVTFGLIQDLDAGGFLRWLLEHEGEKADVVAILASGADSVSFAITVSPADIGGSTGPNPVASTATMPIDGKPAFA